MYAINLPKPFFILAPMDEVTDTVFRQTVVSTAPPSLFFTEFANVDGLVSVGRLKLFKKLRFVEAEKGLVAQIWGLNPDNFRTIAGQIADGSLAKELGLPDGCNFVGVDLNMGCPAKSEVQNGACSALIQLQNRVLAEQIIDATKEGLAGRLPLSVKTRLGFNEVDMSWFEFLLSKELDLITVHGRTRKEMSKVPAHWDLIGEVAKLRNKLAPETLIAGNGDVMSHAQGVEFAKTYGLDGIMIGRGIFQDPFVFAAESPWKSYTKEQKIALYRSQVELFAKTWPMLPAEKGGGFKSERHIKTLNKFCKVYINGFDGAKELRERLMASETTDELLALLVG